MVIPNFQDLSGKKQLARSFFHTCEQIYIFLSPPARVAPKKLMLYLCTPNIFTFDLPHNVCSPTPPHPSLVTIFAESFTQTMIVVIFVIQKVYMLYELGLGKINLACEVAHDFPVLQNSKGNCRHEKIISSHTLTTLANNHLQVKTDYVFKGGDWGGRLVS